MRTRARSTIDAAMDGARQAGGRLRVQPGHVRHPQHPLGQRLAAGSSDVRVPDGGQPKQQAYWTQIANTFKTYDQHLLFAGTNEVHADYNTPTAEHNTVQQSYNQTFVNAVRATGGNNASRTLVVQTYNTNILHGLNFFNLPTDTIANRLIVEVHHYDPYDFTLNPNGPCNCTGARRTRTRAAIATGRRRTYPRPTFAQVKAKWVDQGIPVIIGEYGVAPRPNMNLEARQYYLEYVNKAAAHQRHQDFLLGQRRAAGQRTMRSRCSTAAPARSSIRARSTR